MAKRGARPRITGVLLGRVEELRASIALTKSEDPFLAELELLSTAEGRFPNEVRLLRKDKAGDLEKLKAWVRRITPAAAESPALRKRYIVARAILLREREDLAERYDEARLRILALRLRIEGADPSRSPDETFIARVLAQVGIIPFSVVDPKKELRILRRSQPSLEKAW